MISSIISRLVILVFGTLYPAYASYKAVKTKNVKEYVKWMMYWIVFALFTCAETVTDVFFSWLPFYYEIKIILVVWLLSPATKGSSILYRKFVHPALSSREQEIDEYISKAKEQSYRQFLDLGSKGVSALMQTAIKGGGGIVNQLRKSYSLSDLSDPSLDGGDGRDERDVVITDPRLLRRRRSPGRTASSSSVYFSEVDVRSDRIAQVQSLEDISSGYSSGEGLYPGQPPKLQAREGLVRAGSLTRTRVTRVTRSTALPKKASVSEESDESEVFDTNVVFLNDKAQNIDELDNQQRDSSEGEFVDSLDTLHEPQLEDKTINITGETLLTACPNVPVKLPATRVKDEIAITSKEMHVKGCNTGDRKSVIENQILNVNEVIVADKKDTTEEEVTKRLSLANAVGTIRKDDIATPLNTVTTLLNNAQNRKERELLEPETISEISESDESTLKEVSVSEPSRRGKYHKKVAPKPPEVTKKCDLESVPAIKATLVLKPGVVKPIGNSTSECKEVFIQSPKSKRRTLINRSPSTSKSKLDSSFSKLIKFPKKIGFWNKDDAQSSFTGEKRSSWHDFSNHLKLSNSKIQSKSHNDLTKVSELKAEITVKPAGSHFSIQALTESPLAKRRLKILRRYVDEDID